MLVKQFGGDLMGLNISKSGVFFRLITLIVQKITENGGLSS